MEASVDNEFMQYWSKLTVTEKESLPGAAKNYVQSKHEDVDGAGLRRRIILQEREEYLQGKGNNYSWEEVKQMAMNKEKRHAI